MNLNHCESSNRKSNLNYRTQLFNSTLSIHISFQNFEMSLYDKFDLLFKTMKSFEGGAKRMPNGRQTSRYTILLLVSSHLMSKTRITSY